MVEPDPLTQPSPHPEVDGTLLTVGHGTLPADGLAELLQHHGVDVLVDVRSFPGSRRHPHFGREAMEGWVPAAGIDYRWERRLGGRRKPAADSRHIALRHEAFRAYADHMESAEFHDGLDWLIDLARQRRTAIMCSESVWWRCHRRLISDAATLLRDMSVQHLFHDDRLRPHAVTPAARVEGSELVYDVEERG